VLLNFENSQIFAICICPVLESTIYTPRVKYPS